MDVATFMDPRAKLKADFPSTIGLTTEGDHIWSIPTKADVKSMIWYPAKAFAAKGYEVPKTWDELVALADKIVADGTPSVLRQRRRPRHGDGLAADGLGRGGPPQDRGSAGHQRLDQPQDHRSPIPRSRPPSTRLASLLFKDGYVDGGGQAIVNNDMKTVMDPMFNRGHGRSRLLDAEDPRLVRPGLLPGSPHQRR